MEREFENWKDCKGYEGLYQISDQGRVWSIKTQRYLRPFINTGGYQQVALTAKNGKVKKELVHRLVALAFIENPKNLPQVNHLDEVKTHNWVSNLSWVTCKENNNYGTKNMRAKLKLSMRVAQYDLDGNLINIWDSQKDAETLGGYDQGCISQCISGKQKKHKGYIWKQYEDRTETE